MAAPTSDPVTNFLARFGVRDVAHFIIAYVATFLPLLNLTNTATLKASAMAAIPAAAAVVYRQVFPHPTASTSPPAQNVVAVVQAVPPTTPGA